MNTTMLETAATEQHPAEVLMRLIVHLLAPMFLPVTNGDIAFARMAAAETINQHNPRNHVDLIIIAQIIACGLASVNSINQSLTGDLSPSLTLRFRANAAALNRVAERTRKALNEATASASAQRPAFVPDPNQEEFETKVRTDLAETRKRTAQALARFQKAEPAPTPQEPEPTPDVSPDIAMFHLARNVTDQEWQLRWAAAMSGVAEEFTAELKNLPPEERELAARRANSLSQVANQLVSGKVPPRLRPGAPIPI